MKKILILCLSVIFVLCFSGLCVLAEEDVSFRDPNMPDFVYEDNTYPAEGYNFTVHQKDLPAAAETNTLYTDAESWARAFEVIDPSETVIFVMRRLSHAKEHDIFIASRVYVLPEEAADFPEEEDREILVIHSDGEEDSANKEFFDYSKVVTQEMVDWGLIFLVYSDYSVPALVNFNKLFYPLESSLDDETSEGESFETASVTGSGTSDTSSDQDKNDNKTMIVIIIAAVVVVVSLIAAGVVLKKRAK